MLLDWLRLEYAIEKPSNKLLAATDLDSDTWVSEVKRIRGKELPLTPAGVHGLRDEYTRTIEPAHVLSAETLNLERRLSDHVGQAYGLTPAEIALMWRTASPRTCRSMIMQHASDGGRHDNIIDRHLFGTRTAHPQRGRKTSPSPFRPVLAFEASAAAKRMLSSKRSSRVRAHAGLG
jgi:hypothetical protein